MTISILSWVLSLGCLLLAEGGGRNDAAAQIIRMPPAVASPRITNLERAIVRDRQVAVSAFWATLTREGTPIIEAYPPDSNFILVTFVYRDSIHAKDILVSNGVAGWTEYFMQLRPIDGTDVWYKTVVLPNNVRIGYQFAVNSPAIPWWVDTNFGPRFASWHGAGSTETMTRRCVCAARARSSRVRPPIRSGSSFDNRRCRMAESIPSSSTARFSNNSGASGSILHQPRLEDRPPLRCPCS